MFSDDMKTVTFDSCNTFEDYGEDSYRFTGKQYSTIPEVEMWKIQV
jgi:hypothetical protein